MGLQNPMPRGAITLRPESRGSRATESRDRSGAVCLTGCGLRHGPGGSLSWRPKDAGPGSNHGSQCEPPAARRK